MCNYYKVTDNIFWSAITFAQLCEQNQQPISGCETRWFLFYSTKNSLPSPLVVHNICNKHNIPKTTRTHPFFTRAARLAIILYSPTNLSCLPSRASTHTRSAIIYIILVCFSTRPFVLRIFLRHTRSSLVSVPTDPVPDGLSSPNERD